MTDWTGTQTELEGKDTLPQMSWGPSGALSEQMQHFWFA